MVNNNNNANKAIKAGAWYTVANYLSKGAVYLTIPIFSAFMTKSEIGKYMNINAWIQILLPLLTFELYNTLTLARFDYEDEFDQYVSSTLVYGIILSTAAGIVLLFFNSFFEKLFNLNHYSMVVMVIYITFFPALQYYQSINLFRYEHRKVIFITLINVLIPLSISLLFSFTWKDRLAGRVIGFYTPTTIISACLLAAFLYKGKTVRLKYLPYSLRISFPLIWHALAIHLLATGDRIVITKILGDEKNALYTIAYTVCGMATILWSSMNSAWSPWCTERMHNKDSDSIKKLGKPYVLTFSIIMIGVLLVAPEVLFIMGGGKDYYEARFVIPPVLVGLVSQFIYSMYVNVEFYFKKQVRIAIGTVLATTINLVLNILFVPKFGYFAAAYTTLIGYLVLLVYHFLSVKTLKLGQWFDDMFNFLVVGFFILLLPVVNLLYNHTLARYIVLSAYAMLLFIIVFRNKTIIKGLLMKMRKKSST